MSHRRTSRSNKDSVAFSVERFSACCYRSLWLVTAAVVLLVMTVASPSAEPIAGLDDGLSAQERSAIYEEISQATRDSVGYRGIIIVDSVAHNAFIGMYQPRFYGQVGWDLFGRTIRWAISHEVPATTRIRLFTYNGSLDPSDGREADGVAVHEYLIDSMGFNPDSITVASQTTMNSADFTGYDLVVYINVFGYPAWGALNEGVPLVSTSNSHAQQMGIGTGENTIHEFRDFAWIQDVDHEITSPWEPGLLDLQRSSYIHATYPNGMGAVLLSADSGWYTPPPEPVAIKIGRVSSVPLGSTVTVDVTLDSTPNWFDMGGFDFLVAWDASHLEVLSVSPGGLLDSCGWEYFVYSAGPAADCGGQPCPEGYLRMVGVADIASTPGSPACYADTTGTLAQIDFRVSSDQDLDCRWTRIIFAWYDCGDNSLASLAGDSLYLSQGVYDFIEGMPTDTTFPTVWGAPDHCITDSSTMLRRINFHNGYVQFVCNSQPPPVPDSGDVNLNGLAFEIADLVLFSNYFFYGLGVFNVHLEAQVAATEVNGDGLPLTVQDLTYMSYVIRGIVPVPHHPPEPGDTAFFSQDTLAKIVNLSYPDSLKLVYLIFEGDLIPGGDSTYPFDGQFTRVLIHTLFSNSSTILERDSLLFYTGQGTLVAAYAAFDGYTPIPTAIVGSTGDCCEHKGNVDNDPSGEMNIADLVYLVQYMFGNGPEPPCMRQADVIEDWSIDLVDLVFLVNHMFNGGAAPAPCF